MDQHTKYVEPEKVFLGQSPNSISLQQTISHWWTNMKYEVQNPYSIIII